MATEKRTYGLMIERGRNSLGDRHVYVSVMAREDDAAHPINPKSDGESTIWGAPKHLDGIMLDTFGLYGGIYIPSHGERAPEFVNYRVQFRHSYWIDRQDVARMSATFKRWDKQAKLDDPREPAEYFMTLVRAFRLEWAVYKADGRGAGGTSYANHEWLWRSPTEGREHYRQSIARELADASGRTVAA